MGKCRKASKRRRNPECPYCEHYVRRGIEQHLKRCELRGAMERDPSDPIEVLGYAEIAVVLGVTRQRASQVARNHKDFPKPFALLSGRPLYLRAPVEKFAREWERKTGRPPKQS